MIRFEYTISWFLTLSLFDLLWMSLTELIYWALIAHLKSYVPQYMADVAEEKRKEASGNTSIVQFSFAYLIGFLVLLNSALHGVITWPEASLTFLSFMILHYAGNEDLLYFIINFILNIIPCSWWSTRKFYNFKNHKLPKECPWLYEDRKIWKFTIRPYIIRWICGKSVPFKKLLISGVIGWVIVILIDYIAGG